MRPRKIVLATVRARVQQHGRFPEVISHYQQAETAVIACLRAKV